MRVALLIEGKTEVAFVDSLRAFLGNRLAGAMPRLDPVPFDGRLPTEGRLKRVVEALLHDRQRPADAVIALTDVYTGTREFVDAADAKQKMRDWVGPNDRFFAHAAQYDFEAWLLPFWSDILRLAGHNRSAPGPEPEKVDHDNPPAHRLKEVFLTGSKGRAYVKPRDAKRILKNNDLLVSAAACPELKALLNRILTLCGGAPV